MLRTRNSQASSALKLLEQRGILVRKQRKGTFVSKVPDETVGPTESQFQALHLVVERTFLEKEGMLANQLLVGIQSQATEAKIILDIRPDRHSAEFYEGLVRDALTSDARHGFILCSAPAIAQRVFSESGLPTVLNGSPFPSIDNLPWCDGDQAQAATLGVQYLLNQGHRQFLVLMNEEYRPGDYTFWDSVRNELDAAGVRLADVLLRSLPADERIAQAEIAKHLVSGIDRPGILTRSVPLAYAAANAMEQVGMQCGRRRSTTSYPAIVTRGLYAEDATPLPFASVRLAHSSHERGQWLVQALKHSPCQVKAEVPHKLLPFQLYPAQRMSLKKVRESVGVR
jgi:DNA-binding LacI/PurR family transcriptional regulator